MTVEFEDLSPDDRTVRILVMGNAIALRRYQYIQHLLRFKSTTGQKSSSNLALRRQ